MEQLSSSASAVESRVQKDGKVVTSRGPGTAMEYAVSLVELLYGKENADDVSGPMVFPIPVMSFSFSCSNGMLHDHFIHLTLKLNEYVNLNAIEQ